MILAAAVITYSAMRWFDLSKDIGETLMVLGFGMFWIWMPSDR